MFERPQAGDIAVLVHIDFRHEQNIEDYREFKVLVISAGVYPASFVTGTRESPNSKYFIGSGKLEEVRDAAIAENAITTRLSTIHTFFTIISCTYVSFNLRLVVHARHTVRHLRRGHLVHILIHTRC